MGAALGRGAGGGPATAVSIEEGAEGGWAEGAYLAAGSVGLTYCGALQL